MTGRSSILSTADTRRPLVAAAALREFARGGYHGTTVANVAREAKISPAYVFKLYPRKEALFVAVHAQSVADIPEIGDALRTGLAKVTAFAMERSAGSDDDVQRFMAYGQLCHLIVTARIDEIPATWAQTLSHGIRHPD